MPDRSSMGHSFRKRDALSKAAMELGRRGGLRGGPARAAKLEPSERSDIARKAARARWTARANLGATMVLRRLSRPKAIIFDGDDTLWLTEPLYDQARQGARAIVEAEGFDGASWEALERRIDVENVRHLGHSLDRFPTSCVEAYRRLCAETGRGIDPNVEQRVREVASGVFKRSAHLVPFARKALATLKARGYRLALLTKGERTLQERRIEDSGLSRYFDVVKIVRDKTPASIGALLEDLDVSAESTWSVGNSLRSDVKPSLAAGVQPIWIDAHVWEYERNHDGAVDRRVVKLDDLRSLVAIA